MNRKGFTLVEIMIVVSIAAVILVIAIPNFTRSRQRTHLYACISNLKGIDNAKERCAMESSIDSFTWNDLVPTYLNSRPFCPTGGSYDIGNIDIQPTCTVEGHSLTK